MTGYVPIPSAIAAMGNIYSKSIFPDLFLLTAQKNIYTYNQLLVYVMFYNIFYVCF